MSTSSEILRAEEYPAQPPDTLHAQAEQITVMTNYAQVTKIHSKQIHVYSVEITNSDTNEHINDAPTRTLLFSQALNTPSPLADRGGVLFDGREYAYAPRSLHDESWTDSDSKHTDVYATSDALAQSAFRVRLVKHRTYETERLFQSISQAEGDESVPETYVQGVVFALDSVIRTGCSSSSAHAIRGRNMCAHGQVETQAGFTVWWEYRISVRAARGAVYLNLDTRAVPVISVKTVGEMARIFFSKKQLKSKSGDLSALPLSAWTKFEACVRGLRVRVGSNDVVLTGLTTRAQSELQIDGQPLESHYKHLLNHDQKRDPSSSSSSNSWPCAVIARTNTPVPLRLCQIVDQQAFAGISGWQRETMMALSVLEPHARQQMLTHAAQTVSEACRSTPILREFGIVVSDTLARVPAQVLPRPHIKAQNEDDIVLDRADASWDLKAHKVKRGVVVQRWAVVVFASKQQCSESQARAFAAQLVKVAAEHGVTLGHEVSVSHASLQTPIAQTLQLVQTMQLAVCVLPTTSTSVYGEIKRVAYTQLGVHTQCVQLTHTRGSRAKLLASIVLKINTKLGGLTQTASLPLPLKLLESTMVVSADVCHTTESGMSVASIVWSVDAGAQRFSGLVVQHPKRQEIIENFDVVIRHALRSYYAHTRVKPSRIVYYRDGVSDSQLADIRRVELASLVRGCALVEKGYAPQISIIIARKRHHTRFMLTNEQNCVPGTVVTHLASPRVFSFYMVAHHAVCGVAKPVYYMVLHNACGFRAHELYELTFYLGFAYPIVTRPVTMPASLYYAHRLSGKGRLQINCAFDELPYFAQRHSHYRRNVGDNSSSSSNSKQTSSNKKNKKAVPVHLVPVHSKLADSMYFM